MLKHKYNIAYLIWFSLIKIELFYRITIYRSNAQATAIGLLIYFQTSLSSISTSLII